MTAHGIGTPVQGVTLYSFTRQFHGREIGFEDLVRKAAARGLGPGLEIVGFQSFRDFPRIDDTEIGRFRRLLDETGLVPTAFGANADANVRRDRTMSTGELVDYMTAQVVVARKLGFPVVRVQLPLTPDDMQRLLPLAERENVRIGLEIHAHASVAHPKIQALLERFQQLGTDRLGFIPDWGVTMKRFPLTLLESYRRRGLPDELIAITQEHWDEGHRRGQLTSEEAIGREMGEFVEKALPYTDEATAFSIAIQAVGMFGHSPASSWAEVLPWAVHTHGKFYEVDTQAGEETSVPLPEIIAEYVSAGYSRAISSEYEGFHWNTWDDPFDQIAGEQAIMREEAERNGSRLITDPGEARTLLAV